MCILSYGNHDSAHMQNKELKISYFRCVISLPLSEIMYALNLPDQIRIRPLQSDTVEAAMMNYCALRHYTICDVVVDHVLKVFWQFVPDGIYVLKIHFNTLPQILCKKREQIFPFSLDNLLKFQAM